MHLKYVSQIFHASSSLWNSGKNLLVSSNFSSSLASYKRPLHKLGRLVKDFSSNKVQVFIWNQKGITVISGVDFILLSVEWNY